MNSQGQRIIEAKRFLEINGYLVVDLSEALRHKPWIAAALSESGGDSRNAAPATVRAVVEKTLPPLEVVAKPNLTTVEASHYLNRRPQTLRGWACLENGPMRPSRMNGRLMWATADVKRLAGI